MPWANDSDLANYGFLMQLQEIQLPTRVEFILVRLTLVGVGLSVVGALLSVFLVCYVPVRSDALFSICNMCIALIGAQLAFAGAENAFPEKIMCKFSTAALHYLFLSMHAWAMAFSIHLVMKLFRILHGKRAKRRFVLVLTGWVAPMVVVATTAVLAGDGYGDHRLCWLSVDNGSQWAFVGPVCFTVTFNVLVLITVLVVQYRHDVKKDLGCGQIVKNALSTSLTQLPVTNVTWLLGLAPPNYYAIQYLFVIVNASQGALILTCHMLCSSQIRNLLKTRFQGMEMGGEGGGGVQKQNGQGQNLSKSNSTGGTQSLEMDIVGEGLKPVRFTKKTNDS